MLKEVKGIDMEVIKRDGRREQLDLNKFHKMVEEACEGLSGVSASQVEMNSGIQFYNGITTKEIQKILVRSASDLITLDQPGYQYVAARLLLFGLYKEVFGQFEPLPLVELINRNIAAGVYDKEITSYYSDEEWAELNNYIQHKRDFDFAHAGLQQLVDKYLVQNRTTGQIFETPQVAYMVISAVGFKDYPSKTRLSYVKRFYDSVSQQKINLPTPIMAGVRTPKRQYASCVLVDVDDTLDSIFASTAAVGRYTAARAGIGLNIGRIRAIKSQIRSGEVEHTGLIPFLKVFEATTKSTSQNGIRGGSASVFIPIWHKEIESIIVLKNNKGTEDNRVRKLDYTVQLSKLFYERFLKGQDISLFSPHEVPGLYEAFGLPEFDALYKRYEANTNISRITIPAAQLFSDIMRERAETGRIYLMNIDHANQNGPFKEKVSQSNLCLEILLPTTPIQDLHDTDGRIATCILGAVNLGKLRSLDELENLTDLQVRFLDQLIDYQEYPVKAAALYTKEYRTLGIGYIGLAHYLAKHKVGYEDPQAWHLIHDTTEAFAYYLTKASINLAKEKGPAAKFSATKYSDGLFPKDYYKRDIDTLGEFALKYDWDGLKEEMLQFGMRNCTLMAQMPAESSATISNATNGIEPPREYLSIKKSKKGTLKQIVPSYNTLKSYYTKVWDMESNKGYLNIVAIMQKFFDQTISANTNYDSRKFPNSEIPMSLMLGDILYMYKMGIKTGYYHNTNDDKKDDASEAVALPVQADTDSLDEENCEACTI